ncbi:MAG: hypothetical protein PHI40_07705 [Caldisericia bacterium]|nr:hypothetical protein [Caldisericia bacterium]
MSITYPDPYEPPLLDPPEALPTSEPASPQIEITITSAMLPTWSPYELEHTKIPMLFAGGKNPTGAAITVYGRVLKNGVSDWTGSASVAAGGAYTLWYIPTTATQAGDVFSIKLWAGASGANWDYKAATVVVTRIGPPNIAVTDFAVTLANKPTLTVGDPELQQTMGWHLCFADLREAFGWASGDHLLPLTVFGSVHRSGQIYRGGLDFAKGFCPRPSKRPYYLTQATVTRISYTPLNLRV